MIWKFRERRHTGFFTRMNNKELLNYCFSLYGKDVGRGELKKKDASLYGTMRDRELLNKIKRQRKPKEYWTKWENVERELRRIIEQNNGEFPTGTILRKMNYSTLDYVISAYHGGMNVVRQKMGYEPGRKPNNHWKDWKNVEKEMKKVIKQNNGEFPSQRYLTENGFLGLLSGIEHHGGLLAVRQKMGYDLETKPPNYWKKWKNAKKELEIVIEENNGKFPTQKILNKMNYSGLSRAISKYYGGFRVVRKKMKYSQVRKPKGYYKDWKIFEKDMKKAIRKNRGNFPSQGKIDKMDYSDLVHAIHRYHGGMYKVRKKMGYEPERKPDEYWQDWNNFEEELKKAIKKNKGKFPSQKRLTELGYIGLVYAIRKYYGGFRTVRKKMGFKQVRKPNGYYKPWKIFEKDMKKAIKEDNGEFPNENRLREMGYGGIAYAIYRYHGGMVAVREKIGYNEQMRIKLAKKLEEIVERMVA